MRNVTIFFILVTFHVFVVREVLLECHPTNRKVLVENYDGITEEFLIWKGFVDSKMDCFRKCFYNFRRITYQFKESSKSCRVYAADIDTLRNWEAESEVGHVTYQLQGRGGFGEKCAIDEECLFPNSECRQSTCGCILGYSFNPVKHACTHGCKSYGKSYSKFLGVGFNGLDLSLQTVKSLEDCQKSCSTTIDCITFDYYQNGDCYVKYGGILDDPSRVGVLSYPDTTHGVRNCYN